MLGILVNSFSLFFCKFKLGANALGKHGWLEEDLEKCPPTKLLKCACMALSER